MCSLCQAIVRTPCFDLEVHKAKRSATVDLPVTTFCCHEQQQDLRHEQQEYKVKSQPLCHWTLILLPLKDNS